MNEPTQPQHVLPVVDAAALYKEFRAKYVAALFKEFREAYSLAWIVWAGEVDDAYLSCCKKEPPETAFNLPEQAGVDYQEVYDQFYAWAEQLRSWATSLTTGVDDCIAEWAPTKPVPDVSNEPCMDCEDAHARMHTFYSQLTEWGRDLRTALNECPSPAPDGVKDPPTFPFGRG